jgi:hypothetical protein
MDMDVVIGEREIRTQVSAEWQPFGITLDERRRHLFVIGKTGSGKSTLLRNLIVQEIAAGRGMMLLDPHGDLAEELLDYIPPRRIEDVIYVAPAELSHPVAFNLLERVPPDERPLVAANVVATFKHLWRESWGPRLEYVLYNTVAALLDFPPSRGTVSLLGVPRMFTDTDYRDRIVSEVRDPRVRAFWEEEFAGYSAQFAAEIVSPVQNKIGAVLAAPAVRNMLGQATSTLRVAEAMDERRIVIANLAKGRLGEAASNLIGSMLVTAVQLGALRRATLPENERVDFALFIDEFNNFKTDSFATILSESRKYALSLICATQYLDQIPPAVRAAVFGNIGTMVSFAVGHADAQDLAGEFDPYGVETLTGLRKGEVCVRTVADSDSGQPFLGNTFADVGWRYPNRANVIVQGRRRWGRRREVVEAKIARWSGTSVLARRRAALNSIALPYENCGLSTCRCAEMGQGYGADPVEETLRNH